MPCLLSYLARAASSNGALWSRALTQWPTRDGILEEFNTTIDRRTLLADRLKNPWSKMNYHFLGRPGLTAFLSSWSHAFSTPELAAFHFKPSAIWASLLEELGIGITLR